MFQCEVDSGLAWKTRLHDGGIRLLVDHGRKRRVELVCATDPDGLDSNTEYATGILDLFDVRSGEWVARVSEDGHAARRRQHVADEFKAFFREPGRTGQPSDVAARPRQAGNETGSNWIARPRHDDWNLCRRMPRRGDGRRQRRDDDIDLEKNQFVSQPAQALRLAIGGAELERDALPLDVAVLAQARPELAPEGLGIGGDEDADSGQLGLLRALR